MSDIFNTVHFHIFFESHDYMVDVISHVAQYGIKLESKYFLLLRHLPMNSDLLLVIYSSLDSLYCSISLPGTTYNFLNLHYKNMLFYGLTLRFKVFLIISFVITDASCQACVMSMSIISKRSFIIIRTPLSLSLYIYIYIILLDLVCWALLLTSLGNSVSVCSFG